MKATLRDIILGLIFLVIGMLILKNFIPIFSTNERETCKSSILAYTRSDFFSIDEIAKKCVPNIIIINGTRIIRNGVLMPIRTTNSYEKKYEVDKQILMQVLADELYECWYLFSRGGVDFKIKGTLQDHAALLCSVFNIKNIKIKSKQKTLRDKTITLDELIKFLKTKKVPDKEYSYYDYINPNDKNRIFIYSGELDPNKINSIGEIGEGQYYLYYIALKKFSYSKWIKESKTYGYLLFVSQDKLEDFLNDIDILLN